MHKGQCNPGEIDQHSAEIAAPEESRDSLVRLCHDLRAYVAAGTKVFEAVKQDGRLHNDLRAKLALLGEQLAGLSSVIDTELDLARQAYVAVDLAALVDRCVRTAEAARTVQVRLDQRSRPVVMAKPMPLQQAVICLLDNACRAARSTGVVVVIGEDAGEAFVLIEDDGDGFGNIPRGTGYGLENARSVVLAHGGSLDIGPGAAGGTSARVRLRCQAVGAAS